MSPRAINPKKLAQLHKLADWLRAHETTYDANMDDASRAFEQVKHAYRETKAVAKAVLDLYDDLFPIGRGNGIAGNGKDKH